MSNSESNLSEASQAVGRPQKSDLPWIVLLILVVVINIWFGVHSYSEAQKVSATKQNAEDLIVWISEKGPLREKGQPVMAQCDAPKASWANCRDALAAPGGPFERIRNQLNSSGLVFADACDRNDLHTLGAIVIEKGSPKPADPTALAYAKMPADQNLTGKLPLKLSVCGRSFHTMNVGEAVF